MSSKYAAAQGTKDLLYDLLKVVAAAEGDEELVAKLQREKNRKRYRRLHYLKEKGYVVRRGSTLVLTSRGKKCTF